MYVFDVTHTHTKVKVKYCFMFNLSSGKLIVDEMLIVAYLVLNSQPQREF